ncbi:MAG: hypothetical protein Q4D12_00565 [Bacteroidales bacterium]|nr:hypothetical protein [Bacteroidales bacterium]
MGNQEKLIAELGFSFYKHIPTLSLYKEILELMEDERLPFIQDKAEQQKTKYKDSTD